MRNSPARLPLLLLLCVLPGATGAQAPVRIHAARVIDGRGKVINDATVTITGSRITSIAQGRPRAKVDYELGTMTLLPGLIDAHAHLAWYFNRAGRLHTDNDGDTPVQSMLAEVANGYTTLMAGFTTVQSPGDPADKDLREAIASGAVPGPRLLTSLEPISNPRLTPEQMRDTVRLRKQQGADFIKIFASRSIREGGEPTLSQDQMNALCGEAKAQGLRTLVHAHSAESMRRSLDAGCTQIEHGVFATDSVLTQMAQRGMYFDPQCGLVFHNYLENRPKYEGIGNYNTAGFAAMERAIPLAEAAMRRALTIPGLKVVFGTDAVAGAHGRNAEDLVCRVERIHQSPLDAITSATSLTATSLGLGDQIGTIAAGFQADIIAVEGNPLKEIHALQRVRFVMKAGRVYRSSR